MASLKIKTGDTVRVIAGKSKGEEGKVLSVNVKKKTVIVEGVNMVVRHEKPSARNQQGGIVSHEAPLDISNVMLLVKGEPTRVGFRFDGDKKVRYAKKTGETIE